MDSSRIGLFGRGSVIMILAACVGCSSSSSPTPNGTTPDSGGGSSSGGMDAASAGSHPIVVGDSSMPCMKTYPIKSGTLINAKVSWPASAAVAKGTDQPYYLWLLTTYSVDSNNKLTGSTITCGTTPAILTLSAIGAMAEGVPAGQTGQVKPTYPPDSWVGVPPTSVTGVVGGSNVGSSFYTDPSVSLQGLKPSDPLADPTTMWPMSQSALMQGNLTYADGGAYVMGQGHPGIRGVFDTAAPYYPGTTSLATGSPRADQFWTVNRVQLSLYGTAKSCTETSGDAFVTLINNRVVGCELADAGGPCTVDQYGFLDSNTTQYTPTNGTFDAKQLTADQTCADVLAMFPMPM
jgi:hypothetical protein